MPYLSWREGSYLARHALAEGCQIGRDPVACGVSRPDLGTLSRIHASVDRVGGIWRVRDLGSANGSRVNGRSLAAEQAQVLQDGDDLAIGSWHLTFTEGFPGLDGIDFIERVGDLFEEAQLGPSQAPVLIRGIELLHRSTERLLRKADSSGMVKDLLEESLRLLGGDRGFLVTRHPEGWRTVHRVGNLQEGIGLSRSVLDYVVRERTAVLSNNPLADPRFGGLSLAELHRGSLMCAPLLDEGDILGVLYLDRESEGRPFSRFDLALFQAFVRQGSMALILAMLYRQALGGAERQGELLHLRSLRQREVDRHGQLLAAMAGPLRRLQSWVQELPEGPGTVIEDQLDVLGALLDQGLRGESAEDIPVPGHLVTVAALQGELLRRWTALVHLRRARLSAAAPPATSIWASHPLLEAALSGLVEPLLAQLGPETVASLRWDREQGSQVLRLSLPPGLGTPSPDAWTQRVLRESAVRWRWADQALDVLLPDGPDTMPEEPARPLLGLVSEDLNLVSLFQAVAEAGDLALHPLEPTPPAPPVPRFRFLVMDALGHPDLAQAVSAYRHHPSFATTPILVVRCGEDDTPGLIEAGATDWLADGFRWEALHHRLQVLRGHTELHQRALAAERLDSFRQMAGTLKHEINNPLAIILMQVEMLQRKYPEEGKLGKIADMVERIRGLVQVLQKMREASTEDYPDGSTILRL